MNKAPHCPRMVLQLLVLRLLHKWLLHKLFTALAALEVLFAVMDFAILDNMN